jgi:hypothetical protein
MVMKEEIDVISIEISNSHDDISMYLCLLFYVIL